MTLHAIHNCIWQAPLVKDYFIIIVFVFVVAVAVAVTVAVAAVVTVVVITCQTKSRGPTIQVNFLKGFYQQTE